MEKFYYKSQSELDNFISSVPGGSLLQSWSWGEIMKSKKEVVKRIGLRDGNKILAAATLIKKRVGPGLYYWFSPRGPLFSPGSKPDVKIALLEAVKKLDSSALFWRLEPAEDLLGLGPKITKTVDLNPARTLVLDLLSSEEKILANMHPKTRYNIRLATKKGVTVKEIKVPQKQHWQEFRHLLFLTGSRDGFRLHDFSHYQKLVETCPGLIRMYMAYYEGQAIAGGLFSFWFKQATYLHGASDNSFRQLMAPQLLQWTVITEAKKMGCISYDFYGISEEKWPGVTRFKRGFGGQEVVYPGTFDLIFRPFFYNLYSILRLVRRQIG